MKRSWLSVFLRGAFSATAILTVGCDGCGPFGSGGPGGDWRGFMGMGDVILLWIGGGTVAILSRCICRRLRGAAGTPSAPVPG